MIKSVSTFRSILSLAFLMVSIVNAFAGDFNRKDQTGLRQGFWVITGAMAADREYAPEAKIEEGYYKDDRREGVWKKYHPNGKLRSEIHFVSGRPHGNYITYYSNGMTEEKGTWEEGKNIGEFKRFHHTGKLQQHFFFSENGKRSGTQYYFHENGNPALIVDITNGKESGQYKRFAEDGKLIEDKLFVDGKIKEIQVKTQGVFAEKYGKKDAYNSQLGKESMPVKDKPNAASAFQPNGYNILYDGNGNITQSGEFKDGKLYNGKWYRYNSSGILLKVDLYRKGRYIGEGVAE